MLVTTHFCLQVEARTRAVEAAMGSKVRLYAGLAMLQSNCLQYIAARCSHTKLSVVHVHCVSCHQIWSPACVCIQGAMVEVAEAEATGANKAVS